MSTSGVDKLGHDLTILEAFAAEMDAYLRADALFRPMGPSLPQLTLGGYLMRQHRLNSLRDQLDGPSQQRLKQALGQYQAALVEKVVRFEERAHREVEARLRQWQEYLRDLQSESAAAAPYYATAVEARLMLDLLLEELRLPPYQLDSDAPRRLQPLDRHLQTRLRGDALIWPEAWEPAYPRSHFWYLYGRPA